MVDAKEIFKGFCRYYNSFHIVYDESLSTHTSRLVSYFDTLGRMLGYRIFSEYSIGKLIPTYPLDLKNKKIDIVWGAFNNEGRIQIELAAELQQSFNMPDYEKDIKKLATLSAKLKVFYCAANNSEEIMKSVTEEINRHNTQEKSQFLVIVDPWVNPSKFCEGKIRGMLLDPAGELAGEGTADILKLNDDNQQLRVLLNVQWKNLTYHI